MQCARRQNNVREKRGVPRTLPGTSATGCVSRRGESHCVRDDKQSGRMFKKKEKRSLAFSFARARARGDVVDVPLVVEMLVDDVGRLSVKSLARSLPYGRPATVTRAFSLFVRALNREFARGCRNVR